MTNTHFNAREYFDHIYERAVILEAKQLTQSFKHGKTERTVLNQIDLKIHKREFICVIGPDRKSTRLNSSHIPLSRMPSSA